MKISNKQYDKMVKKASPPSPKLKNFILAYLVGGLICVIGQLFKELYEYLGLTEDVVKMLVPVTLIFLAALLTALKVFDNIAKHAGAGTLVPITGFANAVVSPAIEFKNEGWILGVGAKMFKIAGPVIVYGTVASVVYGIIYWIINMM
ncbi:MAG: stage V sporulation protein AC [Ruminococcaceae bacterium]|nr:stage V sporulation protein AC [Oscillospiraceae bacterium]